MGSGVVELRTHGVRLTRKEELSMPKKTRKDDRKEMSKKEKSEKRDV